MNNYTYSHHLIYLLVLIASNQINPGIKEDFLFSIYSSPTLGTILPDKTEYFDKLFISGMQNDDPKLIKLVNQNCSFSSEEKIKLAILHHSHKVLQYLIQSLHYAFGTRWITFKTWQEYTFELDDETINDNIPLWRSSQIQLPEAHFTYSHITNVRWLESKPLHESYEYEFISPLPINFAIGVKNYKALKFLLNQRFIEPIANNERGQTPLEFAIEMEDPEAVNILLLSNQYCCPINADIPDKCPSNICLEKILEKLATPEHSSNKQLIKIVETFINRFGCNMLIANSKNDEWTTILNYAIQNQILPIVQFLLQKEGIKLSYQKREIRKTKQQCARYSWMFPFYCIGIKSPLVALVNQPYNNTTEKIAYELLNHYKLNINEQDTSSGDTIMHIIIKYIAGIKKHDRWTIHFAGVSGHDRCRLQQLQAINDHYLWFKFLLKNTEVKLETINSHGYSPFDYAIDAQQSCFRSNDCNKLFTTHINRTMDLYTIFDSIFYFFCVDKKIFIEKKIYGLKLLGISRKHLTMIL